VRVLVTLALLPVWAAVILASENDFGFIGSWFDPLMIGLMLVTVIAVWTATARTQR
jgi:FtsH-binding integral membrane protein